MLSVPPEPGPFKAANQVELSGRFIRSVLVTKEEISAFNPKLFSSHLLLVCTWDDSWQRLRLIPGQRNRRQDGGFSDHKRRLLSVPPSFSNQEHGCAHVVTFHVDKAARRRLLLLLFGPLTVTSDRNTFSCNTHTLANLLTLCQM